jgi:hypothetical protein
MDLWDWIVERCEAYEAAGDEERLRLAQSWERAFPFRESDPDHAVALLSEGCRLAAELGEPWWVMVLNHWRLEALMHFKRDHREAVELAVRNSVAASKPENAAFPGRWSIYRDLICAYNGVDPEGYGEPIREALAYLEREVPPGPNEARYLLLGSKRHFHNLCGDYDTAEATALRAMDLIHGDPDRFQAAHYTVFNCSSLCWMAHRRGEWKKLAEAAAVGEEAARVVGHQMELCEFLMWQAALARRGGDERLARRLFTAAAAKMAGLQMPPEREYPDALALYHELGGELDKVLAVRDHELAAVASSGRLGYECETHLKRAALLAKIGRLRAADLDAARAAALKLRKPEKALDEIEQLTASGGAGDD